MPTFSSGPIDRFKRFNENYETIPERDELMDMLEEAVKYIMLGFLYKVYLSSHFRRDIIASAEKFGLCRQVVSLTSTL